MAVGDGLWISPHQLPLQFEPRTGIGVADPEKLVFRSYGVETGTRGWFSPTVMRDYVSALRAGYPAGMFTSDGASSATQPTSSLARMARCFMPTTAFNTRTR